MALHVDVGLHAERSSYVTYTFLSGEWRHLVPNRNSFKEAWMVVLHDLP